MSWQRRLRAILLVVGVGVAAAVFVTTGRRETPAARPPVPREDPAAVVESAGAFLVQVKGERETVTIRAEKQLSYPDGSTRLVKATITSVRQGRTFLATGDEARVGENQTNLDLKGNVRLHADDGLEVSAESATYSQSDGMVRAPGPVTFKRGRLSGSGVDFTYDEDNDLLGLSDQSKVRIAGATPDAPAIDVTSGSAVLGRRDRFVNFERAVHIVRGKQVIDAQSALGDLSETQEHLQGLELQGGARIHTPEAAAGELRLMTGEVINLTYYENSDLLQAAVITGAGALQIAGGQGAPDRVLHAENIDMGMASDGTTLTSLNGRDKVALDLPGTQGQPAKSVNANALVATGAEGKGLTAATFSENVTYRETGGKPAVKRTVTSRRLQAALDGGLGEIREALFEGNMRLRDESGGAAANADSMRYQVVSGQAELTGTSAGTPHVVNDQMVVDAPRVEMAIEGSRLRAIGSPGAPVRTVMQPSKDPKTERRTPGIMQQDRPINGVSGELLYVGGDASTADFMGGAQLWQDAAKGDVTRIKGDKISIESKTGNLVAVGSVISTMGVQDVNPTTKERETSRSTGQGQQMIYEDALHRVTYKTKATLVGVQGDLRGETIVLTLGANGQDVERLEATDNVVLREVDRETAGDHLVYIAATGEYTMSGKGRLVRMRRNTPEGCRMSEGSVLTFSRSTDSLRIEGRVETRTQTSSDSACPPAKH